MRIEDILQHKGTQVVTTESHRTVHDAICRMNEHKIGALVVTEADGTVAGIITERDVLRECGERCSHFSENHDQCGCLSKVEGVMTRELITGLPSDDLSYVMALMTKHRIRHLPVIEKGELLGMVSIGDVVKASVEEREVENRQLKSYISGETY